MCSFNTFSIRYSFPLSFYLSLSPFCCVDYACFTCCLLFILLLIVVGVVIVVVVVSKNFCGANIIPSFHHYCAIR